MLFGMRSSCGLGEYCAGGTLFSDGVGWVHRIKADLTYVDLDVPPDDAVTVTGAWPR